MRLVPSPSCIQAFVPTRLLAKPLEFLVLAICEPSVSIMSLSGISVDLMMASNSLFKPCNGAAMGAIAAATAAEMVLVILGYALWLLQNEAGIGTI